MKLYVGDPRPKKYKFILLVSVFISLGFFGGFVFSRLAPSWRVKTKHVLESEPFKQAAIAATIPVASAILPPAETVPETERQIESAVTVGDEARTVPASHSMKKPRIAFVIDDVGHNQKYADLIFSMEQPITCAILPGLAYSTYFAEEAKRRGLETLLHLPLEPENPKEDPGPGKVTTQTKPRDIRSIVEEDLASVPGVSGVNNHMGSRATKDRVLMYFVLKELKRHNLFFLDSLTHPDSVAFGVADAIGIPALKRDVFLDNVDDLDYITKQIEEAARIAKKSGQAVAIGHVREKTLLAIKQAIPRLEEQGIEIVKLQDLI